MTADFYPASGFRYGGSGGLSNVGANGYAWSSAPYSASGVNGSYLSFDSSSVSPESNGSRAYAFPVRCVQRKRSAEATPGKGSFRPPILIFHS